MVTALALPLHHLNPVNRRRFEHSPEDQEILPRSAPQRRHRADHLKRIVVASNLGYPRREVRRVLVQKCAIPCRDSSGY